MSTDNELDNVTDEQAGEYYYRHRDELEREPGEPVDIRPVGCCPWWYRCG
ncbi:MAG: hypothetical protein ACRDTG_29500 [Pseudonocardiaceae bacterium]